MKGLLGRFRAGWRRRPAAVVALALVAVGALAAGVGWFWQERPGRGWTVDQTQWLVGVVVSLGGVLVALLGWLWPRSPRWTMQAVGTLQIGRPPPPAEWFQHRNWAAVNLITKKAATPTATYVLSGMGGVGKTQLAAELARSVASSGKVDVLAWVTASDQDAVVAGYAEAARELHLVERGSEAEPAAVRFMIWLAQTDRRWLVVLDDLARPSDLAGWWPPATSTGSTVVTTRRRDAVLNTEGRTLLDVGLFTSAEALSYLTRALPVDQERLEVEELARDLGYLPLALAQAAAFIRDRHLDTATYRRRLADRRRRLTDLVPESDALPDEHRATVAATWSLSIEAADRLKPEGLARPVLNLASLLDTNGIPNNLFTAPSTLSYLSASRGHGDQPEANADAARDTLYNLQRLNLTSQGADSMSTRIHALVQRATRDQLTQAQSQAAAFAAAEAMMRIWPDPERDPTLSRTLRANAAALRANAGDVLLRTRLHDVLLRAGRSLSYGGQVGAAADYFEDLLGECQHRLGPDHPDALVIRNDLAFCRGHIGDATGTVNELERVLADCLRVLGPNHPHTLLVRDNLARWRGDAGNPIGAAAALEQLVPDCVRVLGHEHHTTLMSRAHLTRYRAEAGNPNGAVAAFQQLVTDCERILGAEHLTTLISRGYLARFRGEAGDPTGAIQAFKQLLADRQRILGPDHPHTLLARGDLARWQGNAGDVAGAVTAFEHLLADRQRILGPDHPRTLLTRSDLAQSRGQAGDVAGAVTAFEQLLDDQVQVLGPNHHHTLDTRNRLAYWREMAGG